MQQLPDLLNRLRIATDQQRPDIVINQAFDGQRPIGKGRAAQTIETRLVGIDPHNNKIDPLGGG